MTSNDVSEMGRELISRDHGAKDVVEIIFELLGDSADVSILDKVHKAERIHHFRVMEEIDKLPKPEVPINFHYMTLNPRPYQ